MLLPWRQSGCPDLRAGLRSGLLRLVAISAEMLRADEARDWPKLGQMLRAKVTAEWPPAEWEPHVYKFILNQYEEHPETEGWHRYVVLCDGLGMSKTLVGALGAHPKPEGEVEIGYSTLPGFQRRGFATAAAKAFTMWLLEQNGVTAVTACTFPHMSESIKVMERCGMTYAGAGEEPGTVKYQRVRG
jgi:[ribosomal protein S5]-alanine N-acetyltransferase